MSRRSGHAGVLIVVLAALLAAAPSALAAHPTVQARHTSHGTVLVDGRGYTLYAYGPDKRNRDVCQRLPGCLSVWPALVARHPVAGRSVRRRLLGTIAVPGVGRQVTYAGHPLYTYVGDSRPGETSNINIFQSGGYWPAVAPSGRLVR